MTKESRRKDDARNFLIGGLSFVVIWVIVRIIYTAYYYDALTPSLTLYNLNLGAVDGLLLFGVFLLSMSAVNYYKYKKNKTKKGEK